MQDARFIGSYTALRREGGEDDECGCSLRALGIDAGRWSQSQFGPRRRRTTSSSCAHAGEPLPVGWAGRPQLHRQVRDFLEEAIDAALAGRPKVIIVPSSCPS